MRRTIITSSVMLAAALLVVGTAVAQGMASVTIGVNIAGTEVEGKVSITDENGTVIAEGRAGENLAVPPGRFKVTVQCDALADRPQYVHPAFEFMGGQTYQCSRRFGSAEVTLVTTKGGRRINGDIVLQRQGGGEPVAKVRSGKAFKISPGRYQGVFKQGRATEWPISGLQFMDGAVQSVPVDF